MEKKSVLGIISLVFGVISLLTLCTTGVVIGLIAIILGIISLVKKEPKKGMGIAGLVTGSISFVVSLVMILVVVFSVNAVKTELIKRGMTEEQVEIIEEILTPQDISRYTQLYQEYESGELQAEDITFEKLGLSDRKFTEEEKEALKAFAASLGLSEEDIEKAESEYNKSEGK